MYFALFAKAVNQLLTFLLMIFSTSAVFSQVGGQSSFEFVNVPANARLSALGGINVSLADRDVNFFLSNPSLVGDTLSGMASANYQFYVGDVGHATFTYAHDFKTLGTLIFGIQHMQYGTIDGYDASGNATGKFKSGETAFVVGKSHQVNNFRFGLNLRGVLSNIAGYRSSAVMADIGGVFIHPKRPFTIGLAFKNIGVVLSDYSGTSNTRIPFDVQIGATFKPEHMPLRFSLTVFNLKNSDVTYFNSNVDTDKPSTFAKVMSHVNAGVEVLVHRKVTLMAGYNYFIHQALKLDNGGAGAGITMGFSATIKSFDFAFSRTAYAAGNAGYTFSLSKNIDQLLRRKAI
jgi:hypothetical protein